MYELIFLVLGIGGLWLGTELIIKPAISIARHFKLSEMFVGLTLLAIGTDLPELIINITASVDRLNGIDTAGLVYGNIVGSAMSQLALTMGLAAMLGYLYLNKRQIRRDGLMLLSSVFILFVLSFNGMLSRLDGIILIIVYIIYFATLQRQEKFVEKAVRAKKTDFRWSIVSLIGGFIILFLASNVTIDSALILAERWGVAQSLIGVLLIGLGTSLPELALVISALRNGSSQLGVGNLIGSNIFDVLFVLGISAAIANIPVTQGFIFFDVPFLFVTSFVTLILFWRDYKLDKKEATVLIGLYIIYVILKLVGY